MKRKRRKHHLGREEVRERDRRNIVLVMYTIQNLMHIFFLFQHFLKHGNLQFMFLRSEKVKLICSSMYQETYIDQNI